MAMKRTQVLFPEDQYRRLRQEAKARGCSVGELVRDAVSQVYLEGSKEARLAVVRRIAAMNLPVADWPQMEEEMGYARYSDD